MDSQQTFTRLLEQLGYETSPNFISRDTPDERIPPELERIWSEIEDKLQIDAIYFVAIAPIIYFKRFEAFDREAIAELHRKIWNQGQAPLIFVILPDDIRIYNGYETPIRTASGLWWSQKSRPFTHQIKTKLSLVRGDLPPSCIHLGWSLIIQRLVYTLLIVKGEIRLYIASRIWY